MANINYSKSTGSFELLFLIFLILKLTKVITWSWWWITSPLWGPIVLFSSASIVVLALIALFYGIGTMRKEFKKCIMKE